MTLNEFIKKYNGVKVDFDNYAGAQCVDLARQFMPDVLGIKEHTGPCSTSGGAKDLFIDYPKMPVEKKYFKRSSSKTFKPKDLVIWGSTKDNPYGHVAIFVADCGKDIIVFEQDGYNQTGAKLNIRTKTNILGYLRKK